MMPRVFIPQVVERYDHSKEAFVPVHDLSNAESIGRLTPILTRDDDPTFLERLTPKIADALETFSEEDYFLAVGDPSVIAVCSGIILRRQPSLKMLKWEKKLGRYFVMEIKP